MKPLRIVITSVLTTALPFDAVAQNQPSVGRQPFAAGKATKQSGGGATDRKKLHPAAPAVAKTVTFGASPAAATAQIARRGLLGLYRFVPDTLLDDVIGFFNQVNSSYFWALMAMDVIAIWGGRIVTALVRGRVPAPPPEPSEQPKHPVRQFLDWLKKTFEGFNWDNFQEETWREMLTGPMMFVIPSLLAGAAVWLTRGGRALQLDEAALRGLKSRLSQALAGVDAPVLAKHQQAFAHMLKDNILLPEAVKPLAEAPMTFRVWQAGGTKPEVIEASLNALLEDWATKRAAASFDEPLLTANPLQSLLRFGQQSLGAIGDKLHGLLSQNPRQHFDPDSLAAIEHRLAEGVRHFNRQAGVLDAAPQMLWQVDALPMAHLDGKSVSINAYMTQARRFGDLARGVYRLHADKPTAAATTLVEDVFKPTYVQKAFLVSVPANLLACVYYVWLMSRIQSHTYYPANRLLREVEGEPSLMATLQGKDRVAGENRFYVSPELARRLSIAEPSPVSLAPPLVRTIPVQPLQPPPGMNLAPRQALSSPVEASP